MEKLVNFVKDAMRRVPSVRYAYGAAGIAAAGALIVLFLGYGRAAVIIWGCTFVSMVLLAVFANLAGGRSRSLRLPALVLAYAVTAFFCIFLGYTVTAFGTSWPDAWVDFLGIRSVQTSAAFSKQGAEARFGCERGGESVVTFDAPPGTEIANVEAKTVDVGDAKAASASIVSRDRHSATAKANFFGRDLDWVHNCPSGGHGSVAISGNTVTVRTAPSTFTFIAFLMGFGAIVIAFGILAASYRGPRKLDRDRAIGSIP